MFGVVSIKAHKAPAFSPSSCASSSSTLQYTIKHSAFKYIPQASTFYKQFLKPPSSTSASPRSLSHSTPLPDDISSLHTMAANMSDHILPTLPNEILITVIRSLEWTEDVDQLRFMWEDLRVVSPMFKTVVEKIFAARNMPSPTELLRLLPTTSLFLPDFGSSPTSLFQADFGKSFL